MTGPLHTVWQALANAGCDPHGPPYKFRARCPLHGTNRETLLVSEGVDQRAVLYCFARACEPRQIANALGLTVPDLYPAGHRHARRPIPPRRRSDLEPKIRTVANVLTAHQWLGTDWEARIDAPCGYCGAPRSGFIVAARFTPVLFCPEGCTPDEYTGALAARLTTKEAA
jgi:hypothetical protein